MKKGFTLIEVIAVIVILGIIGLIAVPIANNITNSSKEKLYDEQVDRIIDATKKLALDDGDYLPEEIDGSMKVVKLETIQSNGYLTSDDIENPLTKEKMNGEVTITYYNNEYIYEYGEYVYSYEPDDTFRKTPTSYSTTRPTGTVVYLRHKKKGNKLVNHEVCYYENDNQFCLKPNEYELAKQKELVLMGFEESTWRKSVNPDGIIYYTFGDKKECVFNSDSTVCYLPRLTVDVDIYNQVNMIDRTTELKCKVLPSGYAGCGSKDGSWSIIR